MDGTAEDTTAVDGTAVFANKVGHYGGTHITSPLTLTDSVVHSFLTVTGPAVTRIELQQFLNKLQICSANL